MTEVQRAMLFRLLKIIEKENDYLINLREKADTTSLTGIFYKDVEIQKRFIELLFEVENTILTKNLL